MSDQPPVDFEITEQSGTVREVLRLSVPLVVAHMSQSLMWVVDTFVLGRVGSAQQGAAGMGGVLVWAVTCLFAGTMTATNILVAQDFGAGRSDLTKHVRSGLLLAIPASLFIASAIPLVPDALGLMHITPEALPYARQYIRIRLLGSPLILVSFVLTSYLRGIGDTVTPMWVVLVANVFNAVASVVLVFGMLGFPAMGVRGAAWGSVVASGAEMSLYAWAYFTHRTARHHGALKVALPRATELKEFLRLGLPIGTAWLFEMVAWTAFSIYAGSRPADELAAHTILFQVTSFSFMPAMAVGIGGSTLVGQYLGAGRADLARRSTRASVFVGIVYMATVAVALVLFRRPLVRAFNPDPHVVAIGSTLAVIAAVYQPFDGFSIIAQGVLRGAKQTALPTGIMLGSGLFVFIPLVWLLGVELGWGIVGAWRAAVIHVLFASLLLAVTLRRSKACRTEPRTIAPGTTRAPSQR